MSSARRVFDRLVLRRQPGQRFIGFQAAAELPGLEERFGVGPERRLVLGPGRDGGLQMQQGARKILFFPVERRESEVGVHGFGVVKKGGKIGRFGRLGVLSGRSQAQKFLGFPVSEGLEARLDPGMVRGELEDLEVLGEQDVVAALLFVDLGQAEMSQDEAGRFARRDLEGLLRPGQVAALEIHETQPGVVDGAVRPEPLQPLRGLFRPPGLQVRPDVLGFDPVLEGQSARHVGGQGLEIKRRRARLERGAGSEAQGQENREDA